MPGTKSESIVGDCPSLVSSAHHQAKAKVKRLSNRIRFLEKSKGQLKNRVQEQEKEIERLKARERALEQALENLGKKESRQR